MQYAAKQVFEATRNLAAFNLPRDARRRGSNQHGTRYVFPDGSILRIGSNLRGRVDFIEWRERERGPGAGRALWAHYAGHEHDVQLEPVERRWRGAGFLGVDPTDQTERS